MVFKQSQKSPKFAHKSQIFSLTVIGQAITKRPKSQILYRKHCVGLKLIKKKVQPFSLQQIVDAIDLDSERGGGEATQRSLAEVERI